MIQNPHDALFKWVFGQPEHARDLLRAILPAEVAGAIDWATLTPCPGTFVDLVQPPRFTDLLFSATWRGGAELYLLIEHQSTPPTEGLMAHRLLRYMPRIWEQWRTDHPGAKRLPVIVPFIFYHGKAPWPEPPTFGALLDVPAAVQPVNAPFCVQFEYRLRDLSAISEEELRNPAVLCTSINSVVVHGIPRADEVLREGDLIGIDFACFVDGFCADAARTIAVGVISAPARGLLDTTRECLARGVAACGPGKRLGDIGAATESLATARGYGLVRDFVGHGIGRRMHEDPQVPNSRCVVFGLLRFEADHGHLLPTVRVSAGARNMISSECLRPRRASQNATYRHRLVPRVPGHDAVSIDPFNPGFEAP